MSDSYELTDVDAFTATAVGIPGARTFFLQVVSQETQVAENEERSIRRGLLEEAMTELTDREKHILTERRLQDSPTTLEDLASQYGVSRERVRQIEVRAFEKLQKAMRAAAQERNLVDA